MKAELVRVGNSRGIRIPKPIIEECGLGDTVELRIENNCVVISSPRQRRQDWGERFRRAGASAEDELLLKDVSANRFDREEWKW